MNKILAVITTSLVGLGTLSFSGAAAALYRPGLTRSIPNGQFKVRTFTPTSPALKCPPR